MSSTLNRIFLCFFLFLMAAFQASPAQGARETPRPALLIALMNGVDTSGERIIWKPFGPVTMLKQAGNGFLYGLGLGAAGGLVGLGVGAATPSKGKDDFHVLTDIGIGIGAGAVLGVLWGVYNAGASDGGNGTILGTLLGAAGGAVIPLLLINSDSETAGPKSRGYALVPIVLFIGPILGYHLSATPVSDPMNSSWQVDPTNKLLFGQRNNKIQFSITL